MAEWPLFNRPVPAQRVPLLTDRTVFESWVRGCGSHNGSGKTTALAIEIKATSAPETTRAHLAWLRQRLDDRFVGSIDFHTALGASN